MANQDKTGTLLKEHTGIGNVRIASDVLARIAGIAALDVEGVEAIGGNLNREAVSKVSRNTLAKEVKVTLNGHKVSVDVGVMLGYGYNIPNACREVQTKVSTTLANMTGLTVTDVNVRVSGITMADL